MKSIKERGRCVYSSRSGCPGDADPPYGHLYICNIRYIYIYVECMSIETLCSAISTPPPPPFTPSPTTYHPRTFVPSVDYISQILGNYLRLWDRLRMVRLVSSPTGLAAGDSCYLGLIAVLYSSSVVFGVVICLRISPIGALLVI